jgi:hypothetical protein
MKTDRYSESHKRADIVRKMGKQGIGYRTIAKQLKMSPVTVQRQLSGDICNPNKERPIRPKYIVSDRKALTIRLYKQCGFTLRHISELMGINYCYTWYLSHKEVDEREYRDNPPTIKVGELTIRKSDSTGVQILETKKTYTNEQIKAYLENN